MAKARFHLTFPEHLIREPMVYRIGRDFDLVPNIRRANIEETSAWMIMDLEGAEADISRAIAWLEEGGVKVDRIEHAG
ncbi:MAG TPA: NIL domain-containing protein [Actinomycetota bacterium]|nr:NIL domain-containing protein [Actinomycetota bacterium]